MYTADFWASVAGLISTAPLVVDRPKGSAHPRIPGVIYPLDYGYLTGTASGDGHGIDVWVGTLRRRSVTGVLCTVDSSKRNAELKILIGCSRAERRTILAFHNRGDQAGILVEPGAHAGSCHPLRAAG